MFINLSTGLKPLFTGRLHPFRIEVINIFLTTCQQQSARLNRRIAPLTLLLSMPSSIVEEVRGDERTEPISNSLKSKIMIFTTTPPNGASLYAPLIYEFGDDAAPRDLRVEILDAESRQKIATKLLRNCSSGRIDVAPLLRRRLRWDPASSPTGFSSATQRTAHVLVRVEGVSVIRRFLPFATQPPQPLLLSTFPLRRLIARGESEELLLDRDVLYAEVERFTPRGSTVEEYISNHSEGPALFRFTTDGMEPEVERIEVRFYSTSQEVTISYALTQPLPGGVRVAWVGRGGSVEHYTFPSPEVCREVQRRSDLTLADGCDHLLESGYQRQWQLLSAYEVEDRLRALAELGTAPHAWIVGPEGEYLPVTATPSGEMILFRQGFLSALRFTLTEPLKTIRPWS